VQTETIVFFLVNKITFSSTVLIFGSGSMVALCIVMPSASSEINKIFCSKNCLVENIQDIADV